MSSGSMGEVEEAAGPRGTDGPCAAYYERYFRVKTILDESKRYSPLMADSWAEFQRKVTNAHRSLGNKWMLHVIVQTGPTTYWSATARHHRPLRWKHYTQTEMGDTRP